MVASLIAAFVLQEPDWSKSAVPLEPQAIGAKATDWAPVIKAIGKARIVGAGEATHGSHEIFQMKGRLFQALVEQAGFSVLLLEASYPRCEALDTYVVSGTGDPVAAVKGQGFWTWANEEVLDVVKWMRAYNEDARHKVKLRVVGVDMQSWPAAFDAITLTLRQAGVTGPFVDDPIWFPNTRYEKGKPATIKLFEDKVAEGLPKVKEKFGPAGVTRLQRLVRVFDQAYTLEDRDVLFDDFIDVRGNAMEALPKMKQSLPVVLEDAKTVTGDGRYALDILSSAMEKAIEPKFDTPRLVRGTEEIKAFGKGRKGKEAAYKDVVFVLDFLAQAPVVADAMHHSPRDVFLAENALWAVDTLLPKAKGMFWAHNYHVMRQMPNMPETAGGELGRALGKGYYAVGSAFGSGAFIAYRENTLTTFDVSSEQGGKLEQRLAEAKFPAFFLPLTVPWTKSETTTRNVGSGFDPDKAATYVGKIKPAICYDGLVFINKVGAARPLK